MKKKKGFTLIEIIICIALIAIIGTGSIITINIINKNKAENNIKLYDTLAEAASIYINIEKDEQGNTYENGLYYGGTGIFIPIQELHDKGYISDNIIKTLEKDEDYLNAKNNNKAYLLAAVFSESSSECNGSAISYQVSWLPKNDNLNYICSYKIDNNILSNIRYIVYDLDGGDIADPTFKKVNIVKKNEELRITSLLPEKEGYMFNGWKDENGNDFDNDDIVDNRISALVLTAQYSKNPDPVVVPTIMDVIKNDYEENGIAGCIPNLENGLCLTKGTENTKDRKSVYYYTGNVSNNYIEVGNVLFRIVRTTEDGNVKLVTNEKIDPIVDTQNSYNFTNFIYRNNQVCNSQYITSYTFEGISDDSYRGYSPNNWNFIGGNLYKYNFVNIGKRKIGITDSKLNCSGTCEIDSWSDSSKMTFSGTDYGSYPSGNVTTTVESYLYKYIYKAVLNWYEKTENQIKANQSKLVNYNWCDKSKFVFNDTVGNYIQPNFVCDNSKNLIYYFGLLTLSELDASLYKQETTNSSSAPAAATKSYINDYFYTLSYDFERGMYRGRRVLPTRDTSCWDSSTGTPIYLNPSIVLKGNTKIIGGNGSSSSPYIIQ